MLPMSPTSPSALTPNSDWALSIQPGQSHPPLSGGGHVLVQRHLSSAMRVSILSTRNKTSRATRSSSPPSCTSSRPARRNTSRAFVQNGGTFIAGFRLGVKEESSRMVDTPLPGLLRDVMGVELIDYQPIYTDKQKRKLLRSARRCRRRMQSVGRHTRPQRITGPRHLHRRSSSREGRHHLAYLRQRQSHLCRSASRNPPTSPAYCLRSSRPAECKAR